MKLLRYGWALPVTTLGLLVAPLAWVGGGQWTVVEGVLEVCGGGVSWLLRHAIPLQGGARALTLGHVVLGRDAACLSQTRVHERVHVRQVERWGLFFIPAYFGASLWAWLRGQHPYYDNAFEREAFAQPQSPVTFLR